MFINLTSFKFEERPISWLNCLYDLSSMEAVECIQKFVVANFGKNNILKYRGSRMLVQLFHITIGWHLNFH